ncbi:MAG: hypothetical protein ACFCAD_00595 [Pleurocapsa sp.]
MTAIDIKELAINYITDEAGEKTAVILPIEQFESLLEDLEDLAVVAERKNEPATSHADLLEELKEDNINQLLLEKEREQLKEKLRQAYREQNQDLEF